jgi:hypothetical protein
LRFSSRAQSERNPSAIATSGLTQTLFALSVKSAIRAQSERNRNFNSNRIHTPQARNKQAQ